MIEISDTHVGYAAGLSVSVLWTATSLFFTAAGQRIGATATNAVRIALAIVFLGVTHRLLSGHWIPDAVLGQVILLALSGWVGLSLGDQALFTAFVRIGPRLSMLIMTTAPLFAALFGWLALGETIDVIGWVGVLCTIGGVAWVVLERPARDLKVDRRQRTRGLTLAVIAAICQAGGFLLSKQGIGHGWLPPEQHLTPQAATLTRMFFAAFGMVPIIWLRWRYEQRRAAAGVHPPQWGQLRAGLLLATGGAVVGPFLGVWMSLEACDRVPLGIAQTLSSLPPVLILPLARVVYKERISPRAIVGAVVAVAGVALLFLSPG